MKSKWLKRLAFGVVGLYALYLLIGFLVLPRVVKARLEGDIAESLARRIAVDEVSFNPFSLVLELRGLEVEDDWGGKLAQVGMLRINAQLSSIFYGGAILKETLLSEAYFDLSIDEGGSSSIDRLLTAPESGAQDGQPAGAFKLRVASIKLQNVFAAYEDRSLAKAFSETVGPINLEVRDFELAPDSVSPHALEAWVGEETLIKWTGEIGVLPLSSNGRLEVSKLKLDKGEAYWSEYLDLSLSAFLSLDLQYALAMTGAGLDLKWQDGVIEIAELMASSDSASDFSISLPSARLVADVDSLSSRARISSLDTSGLEIALGVDPDGGIQLPALSVEGSSVEGEADAEGSTAWTIEGSGIALKDVRLTVVDRSLIAPGEVSFFQVDLRSDKMYYGSESEVSELALSGSLSGGGDFSLRAETDLNDLATKGQLKLEDVELSQFQPYITERAKLALRSAALEAEFAFGYDGDSGPSAEGNLSIVDILATPLESGEPILETALMCAKSVRYSNISGLGIALVSIERPKASILIDEEGDLALQELTNATEEAAVDSEHAETDTESDLAFRIEKFEILDGEVSMLDKSVQPEFRSRMDGMHGMATGIDSSSEEPATFEISGQVDGGARLQASGSLTLAGLDGDAECVVMLASYDMTAISPYFGKYLGRALSRGHFTLESRYSVEGQKLEGRNNLRFDQLVLGDRVDSSEAISLPIGFAVDVLKDPQGRISLNNISVSGDLSDPSLNTGSLIFQALGKALSNMIIKTATSPFSVLASLVGGQKDLDTIGFAPGAYLLDAVTREKLDAIATILEQRPALRVDLSSIVAVETERDLLGQALLAYALGDEALPNEGIGSLDPFALLSSFDRGAFEQLLKASYLSQIEQANSVADLTAPEAEDAPLEVEQERKGKSINLLTMLATAFGRGKAESEDGAAEADVESVAKELAVGLIAQAVAGEEIELPDFSEMVESLLAKRPDLEVKDDWIRALARRRAEEAKRYLIDGKGIAADRIYFAETADLLELQATSSQLKLGIAN